MPKKGIYKAILITSILVLVLCLMVQFMAKSIIADFLDHNIPDHIHLKYNGLSANAFTGAIGLEGVHLEWADQDTIGVLAIVKMEALNLEGLGYFDYFFRNAINVERIEFIRPILRYAPYRQVARTDTSGNRTVDLKKELAIAKLNIVDGEYTLLQKGPDSIKLEVEKFDILIEDLRTDMELIKKRIPFTYGDYSLDADKIRLDLGPFEILEFNSAHISGGNALLNGLSLRSKYSKNELSGLLKRERDHINLKIPEIRFSGIDLGMAGDRFFLNMESGILDGPDLEIYRDKLIADDPKKKRLYGQMLRELPFDMDIAVLNIRKGGITYAELVTEGTVPGEIYFTDLDADLRSISNIHKKGEGTSIEITAKLMGAAPLRLNWNLDPKMEGGAFLVSGNVSHFKAESINPFLKSNLRVEADGEVKELYFTISGDAISAKGDMKMHYSDFSFAVLRKDRLGVNKLLTAIGNMFVNDGSKTDDKGYRYGDIQAERDPTKSFFNYLWLNIKSGLLSTLTGDGKE